MVWYIYIVSIVYCIWRMAKGYKKSFGEGNPIGPTPGLETIFIFIFAPVLAPVDIVLTWIRRIKESNEDRRNKIF